MNRLILLLFLIAIGVYIYIVIYKNNSFFTNFYGQETNSEEEEYIERKVHFSEKNEQYIIPNNDDIKRQQHEHMQQQQQQHQEQNQPQPQPQPKEQEFNLKLQPIDKIDLTDNLYDDLFIVNPIEIKNTNLTLSENEYFNNM
jgi:hypothetical protein